ncbi:MAG TPA: hypothetical protein P5160_03225 [Candidatus Omnitrophota bacterium]|jgi:hypothetical protein|nr:hypothetical protein [Candidatus Omnitrophota bacterium]
MSTIHDALKKIQNNNPDPEPSKPQINPVTGQPVKPAPTAAQFKPPQAKSSKTQKTISTILGQLVFLTVLIAACFIAAKYYGLLDRFHMPKFKISFPTFKKADQPNSAYPVKMPKDKSQPLPTRLSDLQISGTISLDGRTLALINGNIYEAGDKVLNAEIVSISNDKIVFSENGMERIIYIKK